VTANAHDAGETPLHAFRLLPELLLEACLPPRVGGFRADCERLSHLLGDRLRLLGRQFDVCGALGHGARPYPGMRLPRMGDSSPQKGFHPFG
jgi:hypothetical protein